MDWHPEELFLTALGREDSFQHKQNLEAENSAGTNGLKCPTNVKKLFASVSTALLAYSPKKIHTEEIGECDLRRTSTAMLSAIKVGLDQLKGLNRSLKSRKPDYTVTWIKVAI